MDTWTLIGSAALAATCSGMLSALSGIGGPPLILMFQLLAVPKVRKINMKISNLEIFRFVLRLRILNAERAVRHPRAAARPHVPAAGSSQGAQIEVIWQRLLWFGACVV